LAKIRKASLDNKDLLNNKRHQELQFAVVRFGIQLIFTKNDYSQFSNNNNILQLKYTANAWRKQPMP
jgi:hypothetical protein